MKKVNLILVAVLAIFALTSCGDSTVNSLVESAESLQEELKYEYEFYSADAFNTHVVDLIDVVIEKEMEMINADATADAKFLEKIRLEYSDLLKNTIDKLKDTKPYYSSELYMSSSIDYIKARQKTADETWIAIIAVLGEKTIADVTEEENAKISELLNAASAAEQIELDIAQKQQVAFGAANSLEIEDVE